MDQDELNKKIFLNKFRIILGVITIVFAGYVSYSISSQFQSLGIALLVVSNLSFLFVGIFSLSIIIDGLSDLILLLLKKDRLEQKKEAGVEIKNPEKRIAG